MIVFPSEATDITESSDLSATLCAAVSGSVGLITGSNMDTARKTAQDGIRLKV